jgi:hypothetical protein
MSKKYFARLINISYGHWRFVLRGERNLNLPKARVVAHLLDTPVDVWQDSSMKDARQDAWSRYCSGRKEN